MYLSDFALLRPFKNPTTVSIKTEMFLIKPIGCGAVHVIGMVIVSIMNKNETSHAFIYEFQLKYIIKSLDIMFYYSYFQKAATGYKLVKIS